MWRIDVLTGLSDAGKDKQNSSVLAEREEAGKSL